MTHPADPAPVTRLSADGMTWPIDGTPLPDHTNTHRFRPVVTRRPDPDVLEWAPSRAGKWFGVLLIALAVGVAGLGVSVFVHARKGPPLVGTDWIGVVLYSVFFVGFPTTVSGHGLYFLTARTRFVLSNREMTTRWALGTARSLPLADVLAVQCLYLRLARTKGGGVYDVYQLNLVWKGTPPLRAKLLLVTEPAWVRELAAELAEFLGIPLVDQVDESQAYYARNNRR